MESETYGARAGAGASESSDASVTSLSSTNETSTGAGMSVASSGSGDVMNAVAGGCSGVNWVAVLVLTSHGVSVLVSGRLSGVIALVMRHFQIKVKQRKHKRLQIGIVFDFLEKLVVDEMCVSYGDSGPFI